MDRVFVADAALRRTVTQIFEKLSVSAEDAAGAADVLRTPDLRGVETHGVSNMLHAYVSDDKAGTREPRPCKKGIAPFAGCIGGDGPVATRHDAWKTGVGK